MFSGLTGSEADKKPCSEQQAQSAHAGGPAPGFRRQQKRGQALCASCHPAIGPALPAPVCGTRPASISQHRPLPCWLLGPAPPGNQAHLSGVGLGGGCRTRMQMLSRSLWLERLLCASVAQVCCPHGSRFGSPYRFLTNENLFTHKITSGRVHRGLNHILGKRSESSSVEMRR